MYKQYGGIMLNTCCKEILVTVNVTDWNIWYYIIKGYCTNIEEARTIWHNARNNIPQY